MAVRPLEAAKTEAALANYALMAPEIELFNGVAFHIVVSDELPEDEAQKLSEHLRENGAEEILGPSRDTSFDTDELTHIISATIHFQAYDEAIETMKSVVKPSWVYFTLKKNKIANPRSHNPDPGAIFSGLIVHVADLPALDKNAIIAGLEVLGGIYASSITRQVTHIIALDLNSDACKAVIAKGLSVKIVLPHWFDDSLRLRRKIDEGPYTLPNPSYLTADSTDPEKYRGSDLSDMPSTLNNHQLTPPSSPGCRKVFKNHKIKLSSDLASDPEKKNHLMGTITNIIKDGGGEVVDNVDDADIYIGRVRAGKDFLDAGYAGITIGNLPWLYHLISTDKWSNPTQRLLHYPIPEKPLAGFENYRLCLSNYNGDARLFLENLAVAAGCAFTKNMKPDNTHLITAHTRSEKCDAAREWSLHLVNHLWLEDSYARNHVQSVSDPRYTYFPAKTNLTAVVGQTPIDMVSLQKVYFPESEIEQETMNNVQDEDTKDEDVKDEDAQGKVESMPAPKTVTKLKSDKVKPIQSTPRNSPALSHRSKSLNATPVPSRKNPRSSLVAEVATPAGSNNKLGAIVTPAPSSTGKENETPSTSGRSSKLKAKALLSTQAEDILLYQKQMKRKGGVTHGGQSSDEVLPVSGKKRSFSATTDTEQSSHKKKKVKQALPEPKMTLLVTGYSRWSNNPTLRQKEEVQLRKLGIAVTEEPTGYQYLAAPQILRTKKFVCAIPKAPIIVDTEFITQCLEQEKLLNPKDYPLVDKEGEKTYHYKLDDALNRAKRNRGRLLNGKTVYITAGVKGGLETYEAIITANGGETVNFSGRQTLARKHDDEMSDDDGYVYLITGDLPADRKIWPKFREQAEVAGFKPRIVKTDWLLDLALAQEPRWHASYAKISE